MEFHQLPLWPEMDEDDLDPDHLAYLLDLAAREEEFTPYSVEIAA